MRFCGPVLRYSALGACVHEASLAKFIYGRAADVLSIILPGDLIVGSLYKCS